MRYRNDRLVSWLRRSSNDSKWWRSSLAMLDIRLVVIITITWLLSSSTTWLLSSSSSSLLVWPSLCNYRHIKLGVFRSLGFQSSGLKSCFNELGTRGSSVGNISITPSTGTTPLMEILFLDNSDGDSPFRRDFIDLRDKNGDLLCLAWVGSWHQTHPDLSSLVDFEPLTQWHQVSIPLVYTQLVEIVIHIYFFCTLFGMQVSSRREYHWSKFSKKSTNHLVIQSRGNAINPTQHFQYLRPTQFIREPSGTFKPVRL